MQSRQLEQLASNRPEELKAMVRQARAAGATRTPGRPLRRHTGWALVWIGLRLAESGSR
jgi:hypothetical protein